MKKTILQQLLTDKKGLNINSSFQTDAIFYHISHHNSTDTL